MHGVIMAINEVGEVELMHDPNPNSNGLKGQPVLIYLLMPM
jgi:hypothetical protein